MGSVGVHVPVACHAYTGPIACSGSEPGVQGGGGGRGGIGEGEA